MEAFYSVIYIKTTPLTDERIAVGLLGGGGEGPFFYLSSAKLRIAMLHFEKPVANNLKKQLRYFKEIVDQYREQRPESLLFDPHFSKEQLQSISEKTNGAIAFSMPVNINEDMTLDFFSLLATKIIGKEIRNTPVLKPSPFLMEWKNWQKYLKGDEAYQLNVDASEISDTLARLVKIPVFRIADQCCFFPWDTNVSDKKQKTIISALMLLSNQMPQATIVAVVHHKKDIKTLEKLLRSTQLNGKITVQLIHELYS